MTETTVTTARTGQSWHAATLITMTQRASARYLSHTLESAIPLQHTLQHFVLHTRQHTLQRTLPRHLQRPSYYIYRQKEWVQSGDDFVYINLILRQNSTHQLNNSHSSFRIADLCNQHFPKLVSQTLPTNHQHVVFCLTQARCPQREICSDQTLD